MYIIGIVGGTRIGYQDTAATLIKDGRIVGAVEEERILRVKHAPGRLPELAIKTLLSEEGIAIEDVSYVYAHGITWKPDFREVFAAFLKSKFGHSPKVELVHHHDAHAASAYYGSGFDEAMVLTMDLSGDGCSVEWAVGRDGKLEVQERYERPRSLGIFYATITEYCGFLKDSDEYKLMGLSSYGNGDRFDFSWFLPYGDGGFDLNTDYVMGFKPGQPGPSKQVPLYTQAFVDKMGRPPRIPGSPMTSFYEDVAASAQRHLERVVVDMVTHFHRRTGLRKLCLAGGVALNVVVNQRLMNLDFIDDLYIQPAANDAGVSVGAAYLGAVEQGHRPEPMANAYLGPSCDDAAIEEALKMAGVPYRRVEDPAAHAADLVARDKVVGWFQGRMELGPRALGARSILANPRNPGMQDIVNVKVKFREEFRPFCPSVLEEEAKEHFVGKATSAPYMTITFDVPEEKRKAIPSVTHVDGTARIQTVNEEQNAIFYRYLKALKERNGLGVTMNTSFNVKGDPIVNTPFQALATFYGSGMDALVIGPFALEKNGS